MTWAPAPRQFPQVQEQRYPLSNCISCTICMEVCPQFNDVTNFVGAATIAQAKLFNMDPAGAVLKEERLRALAGDGGIQECGFAQNCVQACPKQLPLTEAISDMGRRCVCAAGEGSVPALELFSSAWMTQLHEPDGHLLHVVDRFITHRVQALATCFANLGFISGYIHLLLVSFIRRPFPLCSFRTGGPGRDALEAMEPRTRSLSGCLGKED